MNVKLLEVGTMYRIRWTSRTDAYMFQSCGPDLLVKKRKKNSVEVRYAGILLVVKKRRTKVFCLYKDNLVVLDTIKDYDLEFHKVFKT